MKFVIDGMNIEFLNYLSSIYLHVCDLYFLIDANQCWYHKGIKDITNDDRVITINKDDLSFEESDIENKFMKMPNRLLKVRLNNGTEITGTEEHPLLMRNNGKYE